MSDLLINIEFAPGRSYQQQIREKLVAVIRSHQLGDQALPSSRKMATQLGVSRNTITLVYESLMDEGYLISKERSGFFVNPAIFETELPDTKDLPETAEPELRQNAPDWKQKIKRQPAELEKLTKDPNWMQYPYPFIYGQINPEDFPLAQWRDCNRWVQSKSGLKGWVEDHIDEDDKELIQQISQQILISRGITAHPDEVLITLGTQNSMFMLTQLVIDKNTKVGVENPGYIDFRNTLNQVDAQLVPLDVDDHGLVLNDPRPGEGPKRNRRRRTSP